jgi:pilus assembly protein FimV
MTARPTLTSNDIAPHVAMRLRALVAAVGSVLAVLGSPAHALGMGEARTQARIGHPLRIEIPLQAGRDEVLEASCFQVVPRNLEGDDIPWLQTGRIRLEGSGATTRLIINAPATSSPIVRLAVRAGCGISLQREYALLLDPPDAIDTVVQDTPADTPRAAVAAAPTAPAPERAAAQASRTTRSSTGAAPAARNTRPARRANDAAARDGSKTATAPAAATSQLPNASAPATKNAGSADKLIIGTTTPAPVAASLAPQKGTPARNTQGRSEAELIAELDDRIAQQMALTDRLHKLETVQTQMAADNARLQAQVLTLQRQAASSALQSAPADENSVSIFRQRWPYGTLAALCVVAALWIKRRQARRHAEAPDEEPHTIRLPDRKDGKDDDERTPDDVFGPLTEEDLWPERASMMPLPIVHTGVDLHSVPPPQPIPSIPSVEPSEALQVIDDIEEHDSAVELAEIMMSFGRIQGAAQTLADFIRANPKQAVKPWIKLLEVYKTAGMRMEFDALTAQLNKTFNIKPVTWDDFDAALRAPDSLELLPHIRQRLIETWGTRDCQVYLHSLLRDNREGTRQGFALAIVDEILGLLAILESRIGHYRHDVVEGSGEAGAPDLPEATPAHASLATVTPLTEATRSPNLAPPNPNPFAGNLIDFELDMQDFTKTVHINLDDLDADAYTRPLDIDTPHKRQA